MKRLTKTYQDGTYGVADDLDVAENSYDFMVDGTDDEPVPDEYGFVYYDIHPGMIRYDGEHYDMVVEAQKLNIDKEMTLLANLLKKKPIKMIPEHIQYNIENATEILKWANECLMMGVVLRDKNNNKFLQLGFIGDLYIGDYLIFDAGWKILSEKEFKSLYVEENFDEKTN